VGPLACAVTTALVLTHTALHDITEAKPLMFRSNHLARPCLPSAHADLISVHLESTYWL
jgi:hypothetical protein